jgi:hypothetical protein
MEKMSNEKLTTNQVEFWGNCDKIISKVFGPKRDEVTGEWKKLHNEELSDLYSLPNIVQVVK